MNDDDAGWLLALDNLAREDGEGMDCAVLLGRVLHDHKGESMSIDRLKNLYAWHGSRYPPWSDQRVLRAAAVLKRLFARQLKETVRTMLVLKVDLEVVDGVVRVHTRNEKKNRKSWCLDVRGFAEYMQQIMYRVCPRVDELTAARCHCVTPSFLVPNPDPTGDDDDLVCMECGVAPSPPMSVSEAMVVAWEAVAAKTV